jgi:hypothetical protein
MLTSSQRSRAYGASTTRIEGSWALAAGLPLLAWGAAIFIGLEPSQWFFPSAVLLRGLTADALLYTAVALVIAAPLAGMAAWSSTPRSDGTPLRHALTVAWPLVVSVAIFVSVSALVSFLGWGGGREALELTATSHATLGAVALALAAFGAVCGALFRDPLDAAACSLTLALFATGGLLAAGASVADAPRGLVDIALLASPLVAIASAAHIDLVRMDVLYQISPLAHLGIGYPAWYLACAWYLAMAALGFAGLTWTSRTARAVVPPARPRGPQVPRDGAPYVDSLRTS